MIFGSRHERFAAIEQNPAQLTLDVQADEMNATNLTAARKITYTRKGTKQTKPEIHPVRTKLPDHLPRVQVILEPEDKPLGATRLREEKTEELDYQPGHLFVRQYVRPVYVQEEAFFIADLPTRPLPRAIAGAGLLAQIVIDKYIDHLPLHRQQQRFSRDGLNIPYSTITDWVSSTCTLITPLYEALKKKCYRVPTCMPMRRTSKCWIKIRRAVRIEGSSGSITTPWMIWYFLTTSKAVEEKDPGRSWKGSQVICKQMDIVSITASLNILMPH